jgi:hypothetical protein
VRSLIHPSPSPPLNRKHPNLRIAYVAQHAFHHIEQHLDKTPNEYIQWRYAVGEDREALQKVTRQETEEDKAAREKVHVIDGLKLKVRRRRAGGRRAAWRAGGGVGELAARPPAAACARPSALAGPLPAPGPLTGPHLNPPRPTPAPAPAPRSTSSCRAAS